MIKISNHTMTTARHVSQCCSLCCRSHCCSKSLKQYP